jgi:O-antigen ligase
MLGNFLGGGLAGFGAALPFSIAISSLIIFPLLALWLFTARSSFRLGRPSFGTVEKAFSLFLLISLLSAALGMNPQHSFYSIYKKDLYFVILVLVASVLRQRVHRERAIRFFITAELLSAVLGVVQFFVGVNSLGKHRYVLGALVVDGLGRVWPGALTLFRLSTERATGTLPHPLHYAESLLFGLGLCVSSVAFSSDRAWRKWMLAVWLLMLGLLASQSRGPWLAAGIMVSIIWITAPSRRTFARLILCFLPAVAIFFIPTLWSRAGTIRDLTYQSNAERLDMWRAGKALWRSHPVLGIGPGNVKTAAFPFENDWERADGGWGHLHSIYVNFAAERGTAGLLAFFGLIGALALELLRGLPRSQVAEDQRLICAALLGMLGFCLSGLTEATYNSGSILMTFYFVTGTARAAVRSID